MNPEFYEFWGRLFLQAAQGHRRLEAFTDWMKSGGTDLRAFNDLLKTADGAAIDPAKMIDKASEYVRQLQDFFLQAVDMVPAEKYREYRARVAELEQVVAEQEKTIARLERLVGESGSGQQRMTADFQSMVLDQSERFNRLAGDFLTLMNQQMKPEDS